MGFFDKLFKNKKLDNDSKQVSETGSLRLEPGDTLISAGDDYVFKVVVPLTEEQKESINKSTLLLRANQLYMHYWTGNLVNEDPANQEWQNTVMFFWKAEEPFPKKSLPPVFETFETRNFLFAGDTSQISLQVGQVMPWFGMPGLGEKHVCEIDAQKVTIPQLNKLGLVEYVEQVKLTDGNLEVLTNREEYFFLMYSRVVVFKENNFYLKGKIIAIDTAYSIGGIRLMKKATLE